MIKTIFVLALMVWCMPLHARMYQWVDPDTGTTQLSGKPPAWYRSFEGGPRVFVFDNGKVIDDTGRAVDDDKREMLRQQAFIAAKQDQEAAKEELLEARRLKEVLEQNQQSRQDNEEKDDQSTEEVPEEIKETATQQNKADEEKTIEQMQALIRQWEQQQTRNAHQLIEPGNADSGETSPPDGNDTPVD